jgi:hypothetical protein
MPITILDSDTDTDTAQSHSPSPDGTHDSRDSESIPFYENQLADPLYNGQYALEKELKEFGALRDNQEMLHKSVSSQYNRKQIIGLINCIPAYLSSRFS